MSRRVTIQDIAAVAGVHHTTVSRALKNHPRISAEKRQEIQKLAQEMGYRPDPMVRALIAYRQSVRPLNSGSTLAWISNYPHFGEWRRHPDFVQVYDAAQERAGQMGYGLEEFWLKEKGMTTARISSILRARNITGLLIAPMPVSHGHLSLDWTLYSAVTFGYTLARPKLHLVANHQFQSVRMAVRRLRRLGYRRIGLAVEKEMDLRVHNGWSAGFEAEQKSSRPADRIPSITVPGWFDWKADSIKRWIERHRPEAVVHTNTHFPKMVRDLGYRIPEDIGTAWLAVPPGDAAASGINQNARAIGATAVNLLVDLIHRGERGVPDIPLRVLVEGTWMPGTTVRAKINAAAIVDPTR